jgi:glycerate 2-kinase
VTEAARALLETLFATAVDAALPARCVPPHLPPAPLGRTVVIGAGKGAAAMARAVEENWPGALEGLVVTRRGHGVPCETIEVIEAAHPVPDDAGEAAARRILDAVATLTADDLVLFLVSGGGSALLSLPAPGLSLDDKRAVTTALLRSGAAIGEINCLRKHLSAIKGGRLAAAAHPASFVSLFISDVPGDDPAVIASGPGVADPTTFAEALAVLEKYAIEPPAAVRAHLDAATDETPKPGDPRLANARAILCAAPAECLERAAALARSQHIVPVLLGDALEGEARELAQAHAALARKTLESGDLPAVLISGGEATVTIAGQGRGGPNAEYALALSLALEGAEGIYAIACDTDGIDGSEDNAGAVIGPDTLARARAASLDPVAHLADNDAYGFFEALGDLVVTGPTRTNVNDFRAILIAPHDEGGG